MKNTLRFNRFDLQNERRFGQSVGCTYVESVRGWFIVWVEYGYTLIGWRFVLMLFIKKSKNYFWWRLDLCNWSCNSILQLWFIEFESFFAWVVFIFLLLLKVALWSKIAQLDKFDSNKFVRSILFIATPQLQQFSFCFLWLRKVIFVSHVYFWTGSHKFILVKKLGLVWHILSLTIFSWEIIFIWVASLTFVCNSKIIFDPPDLTQH